MSSVRIERDRLNLPVGNEGAAAPRLAEAGAGRAASPAVDPALLDLLQRLAGPAAMPDGVLETGLGAGPAVGEQLHALLAALAAKGGAAGEAVADRGDIEFEVAPGALADVPQPAAGPMLKRLGELAGRDDLVGRQAYLLLQAMSQALDGRQQQEAAELLRTDRQWAGEVAGPLSQQVRGPFLAGDFGDTRPSAQSLQRLHSECDGVDINALVQWVLRESYLDQLEDLRFFADKVRFFNEQKQAIRDLMEQLRLILGANARVPSEARGTTDLAGNSLVPAAGADDGGPASSGSTDANVPGDPQWPAGSSSQEYGSFTGYDLGSGFNVFENDSSTIKYVHDDQGKYYVNFGFSESELFVFPAIDAFIAELTASHNPGKDQILLEYYRQNGFSLVFDCMDNDKDVGNEDDAIHVVVNLDEFKPKPGETMSDFASRLQSNKKKIAEKLLAATKGINEKSGIDPYDITISFPRPTNADIAKDFEKWLAHAREGGGDVKKSLAAFVVHAFDPDSGLLTNTLIAALQLVLPVMSPEQVGSVVSDLLRSNSPERDHLLKDILAAADLKNCQSALQVMKNDSDLVNADMLGFAAEQFGNKLFNGNISKAIAGNQESIDACVISIVDRIHAHGHDGMLPPSLINQIKVAIANGLFVGGDLVNILSALQPMTTDVAKHVMSALLAGVDSSVLGDALKFLHDNKNGITFSTMDNATSKSSSFENERSKTISAGLLPSSSSMLQLEQAITAELTRRGGTEIGVTGSTSNLSGSENQSGATNKGDDKNLADNPFPDFDASDGSISGFSLSPEPPYIIADTTGRRIETLSELEAEIENWESKLNSIGDDAQLANVDLQNMLQKQQQLIQMMSSISKLLADTAQTVIRKIG